ncbi:FAD-binding domain-containing protein [Epithele typhae]|uniref:FAD-binding domain-containing protein n=1 Tax=Epithele typhae TaxID=378194 RepID=UPI002008164D|nr:FAD-binding domain-containing protein [Epithele typhae]KAH9911306.1 FAD-binding domain-containing protein [Epithele typhae]
MSKIQAILPLLALAASFSSLATAASVSSNNCRCLFGHPCWPSDSDFSALASRLSQPLLRPIPPATPCYIDGPDSPACAEANSSWYNAVWRADQSGAQQNTQFETFRFPNRTIDACYLNTTLGVPCGRGSVPVVGVDARGAADVQAAVKFAAKHNLKVVVKSTGHDYLGRSDGRGGFLIWTHHMKNITVHPTFSPAGAPSNETYDLAITLQSGVQWHEAYDAVTAVNRTMIGGLTRGGTVGAASGWLLGGGHSALSPNYGLGVDNLLEITVVSANGTELTASAHQNADLFWGLRGGGGGSLAVVISATYRTHQNPPILAAFLNFATLGTNVPSPGARDAFGAFIAAQGALYDAGWGGYANVVPTAAAWNFSAFIISPSADLAAANASVQAVFAAARAAAAQDPALVLSRATTVPFASWAAWYNALGFNATAAVGSVGNPTALGSRLLPRALIDADPARVADALLGMDAQIEYCLVAPGGEAAGVAPDAMALSPAWRGALAQVIVGEVWTESKGDTADEVDTIMGRIEASTRVLRELAPDSGCYFNEASTLEPDFRQVFFGSNYPALKKVKARYDPHQLFVVNKGVGSEDWDADLACRCDGSRADNGELADARRDII